MQGTNPHFSLYKAESNIKGGNTSRAYKSAKQKFQALGTLSGKEKGALAGVTIGNTALSGVSYGTAIAGYAGVTGSLLSVAGIATGPIGAGILAGIGLLKLAYESYTNVEKNHKILTPYVWTVIDSNMPEKQLDDEAGGAAMYLITEGEDQQAVALQDFITASRALEKWASKYNMMTYMHEQYAKGILQKGDMHEKESERRAHVDAGFKSAGGVYGGGAVWEFMRRALHWGNYAQAYNICGMLMQDKTALPDFAIGNPTIGQIRTKIGELEKKINKHTKAYTDYARLNP